MRRLDEEFLPGPVPVVFFFFLPLFVSADATLRLHGYRSAHCASLSFVLLSDKPRLQRLDSGEQRARALPENRGQSRVVERTNLAPFAISSPLVAVPTILDQALGHAASTSCAMKPRRGPLSGKSRRWYVLALT